MRAKNKGQEFWKEHLESWKFSGVSQRKYCEKNGINVNTFQYWCQKFKKIDTKDASFIRLNIKHDNNSTFEITIRNKYKIKLNNNYSSESLKKLIHTLEAV